mmetsp:Transcript_6827/g.19120  ORF Transcript_6827/g.19120 Transcript_6827/m.19120 type:complete len:230 (-) Transcript_6827:758-1447(-)
MAQVMLALATRQEHVRKGYEASVSNQVSAAAGSAGGGVAMAPQSAAVESSRRVAIPSIRARARARSMSTKVRVSRACKHRCCRASIFSSASTCAASSGVSAENHDLLRAGSKFGRAGLVEREAPRERSSARRPLEPLRSADQLRRGRFASDWLAAEVRWSSPARSASRKRFSDCRFLDAAEPRSRLPCCSRSRSWPRWWPRSRSWALRSLSRQCRAWGLWSRSPGRLEL